MLKSFDSFQSSAGKRQLLIADDEMINREILKMMLEDDYELLFACDGGETMKMMQRYAETISLVLLDILMPVMTGLEVLKAVKADENLARIPIIVTTSEKESEIESLRLGANDFIPKPYPEVGVIKARILRIIELYEDREIIQSTEKDELTGLYNKEFFYRYAEQFDSHHKELAMDAVLLDVNHFHMINERYGRAYGDTVLQKIGNELHELLKSSGGYACRREADTFLLYCPHREDYQQLMEDIAARITDDDSTGNRVRIRMGVYADVDKSIDIEHRFDRAKIAADTVKGNITNTVGMYDNTLHEKELFAERLIEDFPKAIAEHQFQVHYQPKFDVRPDTPMLTSAEALIRWIHPDLGMISPGVFIPLFEDNGLIEKLDHYVWKETARQIRDWKDRFNYYVPISVNVSRIDFYNPQLPVILQENLDEFDLTSKDMFLEVTESAYTKNSSQIIKMVEQLRSIGFQIEMDDFGTGYSSLNMISNLPIDALKLDMQFIRSAFKDGGNTHMLEVIIGISDYLSVPVIAEGVETESQLHALKELGCDIVQGYFFSKPVPARDFEPFILQKKEADLAARRAAEEVTVSEQDVDEKVKKAKMNVLRDATINQQKLEAEAEELQVSPEVHKEHTGIQLRTASVFFVILAMIAAAALMISDISVSRGYQRMEAASDRYISAQLAAADMESGSDYLTDRVRCFVVTGEMEYLDDFFEELETTRRRDRAVENLESLLGTESSALTTLNTALALSNELVEIENTAMRLMIDAGQYDGVLIPDTIRNVTLSPEDQALTPEEKRAKAQDLVFNNNYMHHKDKIRENVSLCTQELIRSSSQELEHASSRLSLLVNLQTLMTVLFFLIVLGIVVFITKLIRQPITEMVKKMQDEEPIHPTGVEELRFVARTYNEILAENKAARERLSHEASHDPLTGLFNRGAYDLLMQDADNGHMALILIDVDYFKSVNDTYGHAVGDRVLKRVAEILRHSFRSVDILCRIGGDEFAVVMTRVNSSMKQLVLNKINQANDILQHPKDDLPPVSLSVGVAFSDREKPTGDIFHDADTALFKVKEAGRNGCAIYE